MSSRFTLCSQIPIFVIKVKNNNFALPASGAGHPHPLWEDSCDSLEDEALEDEDDDAYEKHRQ